MNNEIRVTEGQRAYIISEVGEIKCERVLQLAAFFNSVGIRAQMMLTHEDSELIRLAIDCGLIERTLQLTTSTKHTPNTDDLRSS